MNKILMVCMLLFACTDIDVPKNPSVKIPHGKGIGVQILHTHDEAEINHLTLDPNVEILEIVQPNAWCYKVYYRKEVE